MRKVITALAAITVVGLVASPAHAVLDGPKIALHITLPPDKAACTTNAPIFTCEEFDVSGIADGSVQYIYIVGIDPTITRNGIAGLAFAVSHENIDYLSWTRCSDLEFASPEWWNNQGITLTWVAESNCQTEDYGRGAQAIGGFLYTYTYNPGFIQVKPRPASGVIEMVDCNVTTVLLAQESVGAVAYSAEGTTDGCNPCNPAAEFVGCSAVPVENTTWGSIKKTLGNGE
jgi:hypothetical protein